MTQYFLSFYDLYVTPIYFILIMIVVLSIRNRIKDAYLRNLFLRGLLLKIVGGLALGLIYQFYYDGGDTTNYYNCGTDIYNVFWKNPPVALEVIITGNTDNILNDVRLGMRPLFTDPSFLIVSRFCALIGLFCFNIYSIIAMFFGIMTFYGIWQFYLLLYKKYPELKKQFAIALIYMPSVFFWGSGIMKDGLCLSALCLGFVAIYNTINNPNKKWLNFLLFLFCMYLIRYIKIYIAICFLPSIIYWVIVTYNQRIRMNWLRKTIRPIMITVGIGLGSGAALFFSEEDSKYNADQILYTAKATSMYIGSVSQITGGSYYTLGDYEPTIQGIIPIIPAAINVALFRPYVWEVKNPMMLLSALESLFFLLITLRVLYRVGITKLFTYATRSPYVEMSLLFSLSFALAVGLSTYNFGTLVRYKIPLMPFYLTAMFMLEYFYKHKKEVARI